MYSSSLLGETSGRKRYVGNAARQLPGLTVKGILFLGSTGKRLRKFVGYLLQLAPARSCMSASNSVGHFRSSIVILCHENLNPGGGVP